MSICAGPAGHEDHAHMALAQLLLNVCYSLEQDRLQVQAPAHVSGHIRMPLSMVASSENEDLSTARSRTHILKRSTCEEAMQAQGKQSLSRSKVPVDSWCPAEAAAAAVGAAAEVERQCWELLQWSQPTWSPCKAALVD